MFDFLHHYTASPLLLFCALIVIAWIWEDATVICGALLASDEYLNVPLAVLAVFIGICSGDLALYFLGRAALRLRWLRKRILLNPKSRALRKKFRRRTFSNILFIRFVPGLRTVGFTLCGLWKINLGRFMLAMSVAGTIWIAIVFSLVYRVGSSDWFVNSPWKWSIMSLALLLLVINNVWSGRRLA